MPEDHGIEQMSEAIRKRAGYGSPAEQSQDAGTQVESAQPGDVDFGAGARQSISAEVDMSMLVRAAAFGGYIQQGGR